MTELKVARRAREQTDTGHPNRRPAFAGQRCLPEPRVGSRDQCPVFSNVPDALFSTRASDFETRFAKISRPSSDSRSTVHGVLVCETAGRMSAHSSMDADRVPHSGSRRPQASAGPDHLGRRARPVHHESIGCQTWTFSTLITSAPRVGKQGGAKRPPPRQR